MGIAVAAGGSFMIYVIIAIVAFFVIKALLKKHKKNKIEKKQQIDKLMDEFKKAEYKLSTCINYPSWNTSAGDAKEALKVMRELNSKLRSLGKDCSAKINQLEQDWQISYADNIRKRRDEECERLIKDFEYTQTTLNEKIEELIQNPKKLAGLSVETLSDHFYNLVGSGVDPFRLEDSWSIMKEPAIRLAKLDPPEDISGRLFQSAYEGLSALIRHTIFNRGTGRDHYVVESFIKEIRSGKDELLKLNPAADCSAEVKCEQLWSQLMAFESDSKEAANHGMMDLENYGQVNRDFMTAVQAMTRQEAESILKQCEAAKSESTLDAVTSLDPQKLLQALWVFAMEKPLRAKDLSRAQDFCRWYFDDQCPDVHLAEWYTQRQLGGADAIVRLDNKELKNLSSQVAETLASGLMWLQGYRQEHAILQGMLEAKLSMSPKAQQRFNALSNGGGKALNIHEEVSGSDELCFDISAMAWKDAEYDAFFENLAFQDKKLTYGLAVRDEDTTLQLPAVIDLPDEDTVLAKFSAELKEEYGDQAAARNMDCVMLSGSGQERMRGVLVTSGECRQLGIAVNFTCIGRKVNIKFYTLFLPNDTELTLQKQQAMSLYKKMSPTVTMWESSLKATLLTAIQQLLNSPAQGGTPAAVPDSNSDAPVF